MGISLKAWVKYGICPPKGGYSPCAVRRRKVDRYENNPMSTSLGWALSYLNLQTPIKIGGFRDRGSPHIMKGGLGGLKRANCSLDCL